MSSGGLWGLKDFETEAFLESLSSQRIQGKHTKLKLILK